MFLVVIFWVKDRRNRMNELIDCKQIGTTKLITIRFLAMLAAALLPITILSFESLIPLIEFSAENRYCNRCVCFSEIYCLVVITDSNDCYFFRNVLDNFNIYADSYFGTVCMVVY